LTKTASALPPGIRGRPEQSPVALWVGVAREHLRRLQMDS
jgi:hypothetical protein